jgi:hypothetical protein
VLFVTDVKLFTSLGYILCAVGRAWLVDTTVLEF